MKTGDKINVHVYDTCNREIKTRNYGTIFTVKEANGKLGIDWNTEKSPTTCNGETFTPFETFASSVIFENVETGGLFHFSSIKNAVVSTKIA